MQTHSFDGLNAEFRHHEERATSAARRYRQAKELRDTADTASKPAPEPVAQPRKRAVNLLHPIRVWLFGGLLLVSACAGGTEVQADPAPSENATVVDPGPGGGASVLYRDCHRGNPPQIC